MSRGSLAFFLALAICAAAASGQPNLLDSSDNPSFETPDIDFIGLVAPPWALTGPRQLVDVPGVGVVPVVAGTGIFENPASGSAGRIEGAHGTQLAYIFANTFADVITNEVMVTRSPRSRT